MKKKLLSILLVVLMCLSLGSGVVAENESSESEVFLVNAVPMPEELNAVLESEKPLIEVYNAILSSFQSSGNQIVYPDTYGGAYVEDGILYVNTTEETPSFYEADSIPNANNVVIRRVAYGLNDLSSLAMQITTVDFPYITSVAVSEVESKIHVGINKALLESDEPVSESADKLLSIVHAALEKLIVQELRSEIDATVFNTSDLPINCYWDSPSTPAVSLRGGMEITEPDEETPGNVRIRTVGICGTYWGNDPVYGEPAILSCGHSTTIGDVFSYNGTPMGTAVYKQCSGAQYYDYSIIKITNGSFSRTNQVLNNSGYTSITSTASTPPVGTTVYKYGHNGYALGKIEYSGASVFYSGYGYIHGLVGVDITDGFQVYCGGGDSGGPVYAGNKLYGLYASDNRNESTGAAPTRYHYSPITGVQLFTVKTS